MLKTGENIPELLEDEDTYYNRVGKSQTVALRDFHNLYVKRKLIMSVSKVDNTLIDLAVGKAGDLPKWIASKLKFVFGIDISKDNIENRLDGACARYLNFRKNHRVMPGALFIQGNSGLNINNGEACYSEKGKKIIKALNGKDEKELENLEAGIRKYFGIARYGYNVVSIQFAIHYMFENPQILHNFLQNVSDNCRMNGYFIGTCYDGKKIFNELKNKKIGESIKQYKNDRKIFEIVKSYESDIFEDDSSSIGCAIDVYQESINKIFREYLVNFNYLNILLEAYGFELISNEEAKIIKMPSGSGMFSDLYYKMIQEIKKTNDNNYGKARDLQEYESEKYISFLNRYFIFKKVKEVNSENVKNSFLGSVGEMEEEKEKEETVKIQDRVKKMTKKVEKPKTTKLKLTKKKLVLKK